MTEFASIVQGSDWLRLWLGCQLSFFISALVKQEFLKTKIKVLLHIFMTEQALVLSVKMSHCLIIHDVCGWDQFKTALAWSRTTKINYCNWLISDKTTCLKGWNSIFDCIEKLNWSTQFYKYIFLQFRVKLIKRLLKCLDNLSS